MNLKIVAKRWFQRSAGNTYHSVNITVDDKQHFYSGIHYGYDEQWKTTATELLNKNLGTNYEREQIFHSLYKLPELNVLDVCVDVQREKDL